MLYKKNGSKELDMKLFENPTSEYRGTPFWAWNCKLNKELLIRQIEYLKEMGFGGFHMHSRSGMATEYLSEEFMELIRTCRDKAEEEGMLAWLYDEDRWPSGAAGGLVTKTKAFREKRLVWSEKNPGFVSKEEGIRDAKPYLVNAFDIELNADGTLKSYRVIGENEEAKGIKRYAYVTTPPESGWYNNQTYVDTLSDEAIQKFIEITYESYKNGVGESFGKSVPAIFTDEPQFAHKGVLAFAQSHDDVILTWTADFPETYANAYGEDISISIPELFWDLPDGKISTVRYHYHDHICERFTRSFAMQCGKWCDEHGIALTGHMLAEATLESQTETVGEAMRAYEWFGIPGIDMLCDAVELTTAKQTQSAVHQFGKEAMLSELYGVTNWDFDFRGHKFQGDWQAALGVTVRVPHLSWVSMKGSAKRDYPASINYQSPWYKEYSYIEDHFARLNTVLTRGKPIVKVGVIHPIESYWLHFGPADTGSDIRTNLDNNFQNITKWLIDGMVDFDFISESLLPKQCGEIAQTLEVGCMKYDAIVIPGCETLRRTTLEILKKFAQKGGKLVFAGQCPEYVDAIESNEAEELYNNSVVTSFEKLAILDAVKEQKTAEIYLDNGATANGFVHAMREDGNAKWFFLCHCEKPESGHRCGGLARTKEAIDMAKPQKLTIIFDGEYNAVLYNTVTGKTENVDYEIKNGKTYIYKTVYAFDSLLLRLEAGSGSYVSDADDAKVLKTIDFKSNVAYEREEDNVYLLDMAEYSVDDSEYYPLEEILRIDAGCRKLYGYPLASGTNAQPWVLGEDVIEHYVTLRFTICSDIRCENAYIAGEEAESIMLNGKAIELTPDGYYVDESIIRYKLGTIEKGENIIEIKAPIGKRTSIENYFLLGNFDVVVRGCEKKIIAPSDKAGFSDLSYQGLPFYGGNVTYKTEIDIPEGKLKIRASRYRGAAVKVYVDGKDMGISAFPPYITETGKLAAGRHTVEFKCFGNRHNTFAALHNCSDDNWYGPGIWYTKDTAWTYEYNFGQTGIITSPVIEVIED